MKAPSNRDFVRQSNVSFSQPRRLRSFWQIIHIDPILLAGLLALCCFGLFVLNSATGGDTDTITRQAGTMGIGLVVMCAVAQFDSQFYRRWAPTAYVLALFILGLVLVIGAEKNGAKSWLDLPGLPSFQPSELLKFIVPMLLAWYLASRALPPNLKHVFWAGVFTLLPATIIVLQNDMGTALMVTMSGIFVVLLAGLRWRVVFAGIFSVVIASPAWYLFLAQPHQKNRILTFFDPL